ncbi:TadE/TadG family type IV pilus assembly protein [Candidatus Poriferisocius sp.]|uniref:TadE/TadG family type IV pilus assembly protein n=1 Tax=Candidatus Poriferisocius sp. TaxID=3101276 RepID=UPI003B021596
MPRTAAGSARNDRGQAAVETALVLPLIMVVLLVLVQVGLLVRDHVLVVHAARVAARAAAVDPATETAAAAAVSATALDPARMEVHTAGSRASGGLLHVTVSYRPKLAVPIVGRMFPAAAIEEALTVRVE